MTEILSRLKALEEHISKADAEDMMERYLNCYPQLREYMARPSKKDFVPQTMGSPYTFDYAEMEARMYARAASCSHSFNDKDECEYCGISEEYYNQNPEIGKYE